MTTRDNYSSGIYLSECDIAQDISLSWLYFYSQVMLSTLCIYESRLHNFLLKWKYKLLLAVILEIH